MINDTKKYWNQYYDVKDVLETPQYEPFRTCNITCVAMITGEDPNDVLKKMWDKYGVNDQFQWEEHLISYLEEKGLDCKEITSPVAWPEARVIREDELVDIVLAIEEGKIIFYHKEGHYQLLIGYEIDNNGQMWYFFNDPAGDRTRSIKNRGRLSGHKVKYSKEFIMSEKIYGRCWAISI